MIYLRRAVVVSTQKRRPGLLDVVCDADGVQREAIAYERQTGPVKVGDTVILNTSAVELGLGTGGRDFVIAVEGSPSRNADTSGHAVKLRYTPLQSVVQPVEELYREAIDAFDSLAGAPVILSGLHSALPAIAIGIRSVNPTAHIAYVMTDAAALPIAFSDTVALMKEHDLLHETVTTGQAYGGDYETVNVFSGIVAATAIAHADFIIAGMGPGNLGTGTRLGFALIEQGSLVNAVAGLGGTPVVVPRISFSDARERHRGVSHHTMTAMTTAAVAKATIAFPTLDDEKAALVGRSVEELRSRHTVVEVDLGAAEDDLKNSLIPLSTMGRTFDDDPEPFRAAAAAGVCAARMP